jgi:hypothetical protein
MKTTVLPGSDRNNVNLLQQFSFPSRRDYELRRSISSGSNNVVVGAAGSVLPNSQNPDLVMRFQSDQQQAAADHRVHRDDEELAAVQLSMKYPANYTNVAAENLNFFCRASSFRAVDYQQSTVQNLRSGGHTSGFHRRGQRSEGSLPEDQVPKSTRDDGEEVRAQALDAHAQDLQECKPRSRNCVSGEVKLSSSAQALDKSSTIRGLVASSRAFRRVLTESMTA